MKEELPERSEEQKRLIRDTNRLLHLKIYLKAKALPEKEHGSVIDLEDIDLEELEYITRISKDELQNFIERMVLDGYAYQEEGTVRFHFFDRTINLWSDLKPNEQFDSCQSNWIKPNLIPRKIQLNSLP